MSLEKLQSAMITVQFQKFDLMLQGIAYSEGTVPVVYLGPVPDAKMIAFVLVLETKRPLPETYKEKNVNELFTGKVPCEITFRKVKKKRFNEPLATFKKNGVVTVGVNFERAQVVVAELLSRDKRDEASGDGELTDSELLKNIKSAISKIDLGIDVCELTCHSAKLREKMSRGGA